MDDLIQDFIAETREMLEALGSEIVAWEADPQDRARLDSIFRFVHTVKGNCGFLDLPRLGALSHAAEDALADVRAGRRSPDAPLVSAVLAVIDRIGDLVEALDEGAEPTEGDDRPLIAALDAEAAAPAPAAKVEAPRRSQRSIRLSIDLLDRMMSGVSDLVLARNELARRLREAGEGADVAVEAAFERASACIAEMRDSIMRTRMQRIDNLFAALPRLVRDLSAELGKQVTLDIEGGDVELDREMIEMIRDPLTHIVRNAVDHGIEPAEARRKAGKAEAGRLNVSARQSGNQILIEVADDGRGIDGDALVARAVSSGAISRAQGQRLSPAQRSALIFEAGLSTADSVTAISGRGVGMDVVRANVERIGGMVELESRLGQGLRLTMRVPLTLTIIPALTVSAGGQHYAIPRSAIEEIVRVRPGTARIERVGGSELACIRERKIPLVALGDVLGLDSPASAERILVVLKPAGGESYALSVDQVHDHEELVVKPAAPCVMASGLYAGTTLADDGTPILLLDAAGIAADAGVSLEIREAAPTVAAAPEQSSAAVPTLLFRGLDGMRRAVRLALVERIEDVAAAAVQHTAGRLRVALGDRIMPLAGVDTAPVEGTLRLFRLNDGSDQIAYGFAEVIDIVSVEPACAPAAGAGEVGGVMLIDGQQVEWLDPYWLFEAYGAGAAFAAERPSCALPDDPWMQNMLRPIIESAGYRVVMEGSPGAEAALLAIAGEGAATVPAAGGRIIRLRARPECGDAEDDSIYRYDRAALLAALKGAA